MGSKVKTKKQRRSDVPDPKRWDAEPKGSKPQKERNIVQFEPKNEAQSRAWKDLDKYDVIFLDGPAGTSKSHLAVAKAIQRLENKEIKTIYLTRAAREAGEPLGALPGTEQEKMEAYLMPLIMICKKILGKQRYQAYVSAEKIQLKAPNYLRGWTIEDADIVVDEAQNLTADEFKMMVTRIGEHAKFYFTFDGGQIDLPDDRKKKSAFFDLSRFHNKPCFTHLIFGIDHVVRSRAAQIAVECYAK